jgi:hypothetical protein
MVPIVFVISLTHTLHCLGDPYFPPPHYRIPDSDLTMKIVRVEDTPKGQVPSLTRTLLVDDKSTDSVYVAIIVNKYIHESDRLWGLMKCYDHYRYPPMKEGEIFPYDGDLYKMTSDSNTKYYAQIVRPKDYPKDYGPLGRYTFVIPKEHGHGEGIIFSNFRDDRIELHPDIRKVTKCLVQLKTVSTADTGKHSAELEYTFGDIKQKTSINKGDLLVVPDPVNAALPVINIVPNDKDLKLIGWVELDSKYVPLETVEDYAKVKKCKVVMFTK